HAAPSATTSPCTRRAPPRRTEASPRDSATREIGRSSGAAPAGSRSPAPPFIPAAPFAFSLPFPFPPPLPLPLLLPGEAVAARAVSASASPRVAFGGQAN